MIIFFQYSFSDFRDLDLVESEKLISSPNFLFPISKQGFAKHLGSAISRKPFERIPLTSDISSNYSFSLLKRMKVRTSNLIGSGLINALNHYRVEQNYFSNTAIFEFVFKTKRNFLSLPETHSYTIKYSEQNLLNKIEDLLNTTIGFKFDNIWENISIGNVPQLLKKMHIRASTKNEYLDYEKNGLFIYPIIPQIIISLEPSDFIIFNKVLKFKRFDGFYIFPHIFNNKLYHLIISNPLELDSKINTINGVREKRIQISNLFIEKENLKNLLKAINNNLLNKEKIAKSSDSIQNGINKILKKINSPKFGNERIEIEPNFNFEVNSLCEKIKGLGFRRQIEQKTVNYIKIMKKIIIKNSSIGVVGNNAKLDNTTFIQNNYIQENKLVLEEELSKLLANLKKKIQNNLETENAENAVIHVENALSDIKNGKSTFVQKLAKGGKWLLEVAKEIGVSLTVELLQKQLS